MRSTGLYAALAALLIVVLALRVIQRRLALRTGIGDGGDQDLSLRIRAHANAIENLPIGLILLLIVELNQTGQVLVHAFGISLLVGRLLHAIGMSTGAGRGTGRTAGMVLSLLAIIAMAALLLWQFIVRAML